MKNMICMVLVVMSVSIYSMKDELMVPEKVGRYAFYVSDRNALGQYKKIRAKYGSLALWKREVRHHGMITLSVNPQYEKFYDMMTGFLLACRGIESFEGFGLRMGGLIHVLVEPCDPAKIKYCFKDMPYVDAVLVGNDAIEAHAQDLRQQARKKARIAGAAKAIDEGSSSSDDFDLLAMVIDDAKKTGRIDWMMLAYGGSDSD